MRAFDGSATTRDHEVAGEGENGGVAVKLAWELKPDLVLMDLSMPEMDGLETTKRLVAELPEVKVVILTASEDDGGSGSKCRALKMSCYLHSCSLHGTSLSVLIMLVFVPMGLGA